jgi:hypothetical protein
MYTYKVTYSIINNPKILQEYIELDEYIEDNEILEEVILETLSEYLDTYLNAYYKETDITITNIEPCEGYYTNKELNNCTEDNKLC